jgi:hypothetical protein
MKNCVSLNKVNFLLPIVLLANIVFSQSLLNYVPPVLSKGKVDIKSTYVLTIGNDSKASGLKEEKPYFNTVQVIDADQSWPPVWYTNCPLYTDEMFKEDEKKGQWNFSYVFDVKIENGNFCFYKIISKQPKGQGQLINPDLAGYILLNDRMEV